MVIKVAARLIHRNTKNKSEPNLVFTMRTVTSTLGIITKSAKHATMTQKIEIQK